MEVGFGNETVAAAGLYNAIAVASGEVVGKA